jgi:hypothetical protein
MHEALTHHDTETALDDASVSMMPPIGTIHVFLIEIATALNFTNRKRSGKPRLLLY